MAGGQFVGAVLDANVIYSAFLRDVLLRLAARPTFSHPTGRSGSTRSGFATCSRIGRISRLPEVTIRAAAQPERFSRGRAPSPWDRRRASGRFHLRAGP